LKTGGENYKTKELILFSVVRT